MNFKSYHTIKLCTALCFTFVFLTTSAASYTLSTEEAEARTRRKKKKRLTKTGMYFSFSLFTPGGCLNTSTICPEHTPFTINNLVSGDLELGYRSKSLALGGRLFGNGLGIRGVPSGQERGAGFAGFFAQGRFFPISSTRRRFDPFLSLGAGYFGGQTTLDGTKHTIDAFGLNAGAGADYFFTQNFALGLSADAFINPLEDDQAAFWTTRLNFKWYWKTKKSSQSKRNRRRPQTPRKPPRKRY